MCVCAVAQAMAAKRAEKERKLQLLWKQQHGLEDDSDSDDDEYGLAPTSAGGGGGGGGGGGRVSRSSSSSRVPPLIAGPPGNNNNKKKKTQREKHAFVGKNGKKPVSWTTGMLWSEHYNQ